MAIALPNKDTDEGAETRILLAECKSPAYPTYTLVVATECMSLMDLVLWNRLVHDPGRFGAKGATTIAAIIRAHGQFAGFGHYPNYDAAIKTRIQGMVDIANAGSKDQRSAAYKLHVDLAVQTSTNKTIEDPSPGLLVAWRTANSGSPGSTFTLHKSLFGIDFYYIAS